MNAGTSVHLVFRRQFTNRVHGTPSMLLKINFSICINLHEKFTAWINSDNGLFFKEIFEYINSCKSEWEDIFRFTWTTGRLTSVWILITWLSILVFARIHFQYPLLYDIIIEPSQVAALMGMSMSVTTAPYVIKLKGGPGFYLFQ